MMTEGEGITATEEGRARGEFSGGILHNFIVTLFTPKCKLCNLDYNLGAKLLNSLNLSGVCGLKINPVFLAARQKTCSNCVLKINYPSIIFSCSTPENLLMHRR